MIDDLKRRLANIDRQLKTKKHMEKKLVIKFWKAESALAMQILEQEVEVNGEIETYTWEEE